MTETETALSKMTVPEVVDFIFRQYGLKLVSTTKGDSSPEAEVPSTDKD